MARMRFDYVREWVDKKTGHVYRQFRRRGYKRIMLKGLPGSVEFRPAYEAALDGPAITIGAKRTRPGTVNAAIAAYYSSLEFRSLAPATQAMRRAVLERFRIDHGDRYIAELPGKFVLLSLAALGPFAARNWLKALRGLVRFAVTQGMCERDPTHGIRLPKVKSDGHHTWTKGEVETFRAAYPLGTMARLAFEIAYNAALRRGDIIRLGRQHIRDGFIHIAQQKKPGSAPLVLEVEPELQTAIDAMTLSGTHTLLVKRNGEPFTGHQFSGWFARRRADAGLPKECVIHGVRKTALTEIAEAGSSTNETAAVGGHSTLSEVDRYTKAANQRRLASNAFARRRAAKENNSALRRSQNEQDLTPVVSQTHELIGE
jgi:integrase